MESRGKKWEEGGFAFIFFFCCLREQTDRRKEKKKVEKKKKNGLAGDIEFREWIKTDDERGGRAKKWEIGRIKKGPPPYPPNVFRFFAAVNYTRLVRTSPFLPSKSKNGKPMVVVLVAN